LIAVVSLTIRRPQGSTLFPYTTLFRSLQLVMDSLRYWVEEMHVDGFRFDLATTLARRNGIFDSHAGFLDAVRQDPVLSRVKLIRSEEHTSELQSRENLVCRLLLEKKNE